MNDFTENMCPKCHHTPMKSWSELTSEQKFLVERLPMSADFSHEERKKHRFCEQCWFEETKQKIGIV